MPTDTASEANLIVLRLSRIALVATVAAFFTLVAFSNVTDYSANCSS